MVITSADRGSGNGVTSAGRGSGIGVTDAGRDSEMVVASGRFYVLDSWVYSWFLCEALAPLAG